MCCNDDGNTVQSQGVRGAVVPSCAGECSSLGAQLEALRQHQLSSERVMMTARTELERVLRAEIVSRQSGVSNAMTEVAAVRGQLSAGTRGESTCFIYTV